MVLPGVSTTKEVQQSTGDGWQRSAMSLLRCSFLEHLSFKHVSPGGRYQAVPGYSVAVQECSGGDAG
jgi:hypothetical protein